MITRLADQLKRMHLVMFQYHDTKTLDTDQAWVHLSKGWEYKMSTLAPFNKQLEEYRIESTKNIFQPVRKHALNRCYAIASANLGASSLFRPRYNGSAISQTMNPERTKCIHWYMT
jgi:hypothetical protein